MVNVTSILQVWEKFVPQEAAAANGDLHEPVPSSSGETIAVTVTDLIDANNFSVQVSHMHSNIHKALDLNSIFPNP